MARLSKVKRKLIHTRRLIAMNLFKHNLNIGELSSCIFVSQYHSYE
jgi:hypothetical protein